MKKHLVIAVLVATMGCIQLMAQPNITRVEWYVDVDPGYGNGNEVSISAAPHLPNLNFSIDLTPLSSGVHIVGVRSRDANGAWSHDNRWLFVKPYSSTSTTTPNITQVEWFLDNDPGYGNATPVSITPGTQISGLSFSQSLTSLSPGVHIIGVRSRDANGAWSHDNKWLFVKPYSSTSTTTPNITQVEWFLNNDPGYGNATPVSITPGTQISGLSFSQSLTSLSPGVHIIGVRSRDANGAWSHDNKWLFVKPYETSSTAVPNITRIEYYIDTDPGYGMATAVNFTPGQDVNGLSFVADISNLPNGNHKLGLRSQDANGAWSHDNKWEFSGGQVVPVHFLSFEAVPESRQVALHWRTASEQNSLHFEVERSWDARQFENIGKVKAAGNSSTEKSYSFLDESVMQYRGRTVWYRLRQVDKDGQFMYSDVAQVRIGSQPAQFSLRQNPVQSKADLIITGADAGQIQIRVLDAQGKTMQQFIGFISAGTNQLSWNVHSLPKGMYTIQIVGKASIKMLKE